MADLTVWLVPALILLGTGAVAGVLAGLLGVGGGIVIVPVLFWMIEVGLLDAPAESAMHLAVATSLATIIPTSISSARAHWRKGSIDLALFRGWAPFVFVGALAGGLLGAGFDGAALTGVFGAVAALVVINMVNPRPLTLADAPPSGRLGQAATATPIGVFSALMGIGGGTLSVPVLTLLSFPAHRAVGTAALFGLVIAVPGVLGYATAGAVSGLPPGSVGYVNLPAAAAIALATFPCAKLGVRIAHRLNAVALRRAFAVFLGVSAARMLMEAFGV